MQIKIIVLNFANSDLQALFSEIKATNVSGFVTCNREKVFTMKSANLKGVNNF
jgi:hypothetical protein